MFCQTKVYIQPFPDFVFLLQSPGTNIDVSFQLPVGAQLLQVFVPLREFRSLSRDAEQVQSTFTQVDKTPKVTALAYYSVF